MKDSVRRRPVILAVIFALLAGSASSVFALRAPDPGGRFDALVIEDPQSSLDVATTAVASLPAKDCARAGWERFRATHRREWQGDPQSPDRVRPPAPATGLPQAPAPYAA